MPERGGHELPSYREISAADALTAASAGDAFLLDVREQGEWDRGYSPLATLVPMSQLRDRLHEVPPDRPVLVVCHSGRRSATVAEALTGAGFDAVSVEGGMIAWSATGGEVVAVGDRAPRVD